MISLCFQTNFPAQPSSASRCLTAIIVHSVWELLALRALHPKVSSSDSRAPPPLHTMSVGQAHNTSLPEGDGRALVWQRSWGPRGGQSSSGLGVLGVFPKRLPPAVSAVGVKCSLTSHSHLRCLPLLRNLQDPAMDPASAFLRPARTLVLHLTELQLQQVLRWPCSAATTGVGFAAFC